MERPIFLRLLAAAACAGAALPTPAAAQSNTIFDVLLNGRDFSSLVAAVRYAGLVDVLSGPGPYTLFAPNDGAFAKLPPGTMEAYLSRPDYRPRLRELLRYHIVPGSHPLKSLQTGTLRTLDNLDVHVVVDKTVTVDDAAVIFPDVIASNGIVHVIDAVLTPHG